MIRNAAGSQVPVLADYPVLCRPESKAGGRRKRQSASPPAPLPSVSIVTVVRDGVKTLRRAVDSVLSQGFPGIEYIVIDGASTDGTLDVLREVEQDLELWISEADRGISDAFNKGIALCRGEIIGLLNSDDWYEPGGIEAAVTLMRERGVDIACGALQYWDGARRTYLAYSDPARLERGMTIAHPTVFVCRNSYQSFGLYRLDFRLAMDYEWLLRAKTAGARFGAPDCCLANMQGGGIGDRRWRNSQREVARARALHIKGADTAFAYHVYVARRITMGLVRRVLDASGLGILRRAYHRWLSPVKVTASRHERRS